MVISSGGGHVGYEMFLRLAESGPAKTGLGPELTNTFLSVPVL